MEDRNAIGLEQRPHLVEKFAIMADADMLEHSDRDDAVEGAVNLAVVHQPELGPAAEAALGRPLHRQRMLLLRQRHADDLGAADLSQIERKPAPARADIE